MFHSKLRRIILALVIVNVLAVVTIFVLAFLTLAAGEKDQDEILAAVVSPDQNYIAYVVAEEDPEVAINADIYIEDIRDTSRIRLTSEELVGSDVTWSPDSRKIAFVGRLRHIAGDGVGGVEAYRLKERAEDIYVVNTDGTKLRNLTHNEIQDFSPTWSPDSKQIAFVSDSNLCVINTVGSRVRCLAVDLSGFVALSWSPIGKTVALISHETIFFVDIDKGILNLDC